MKEKGKIKTSKDISLREKKLKEIRKKLNRQREALISEAGIALLHCRMKPYSLNWVIRHRLK